jgi:hypothetical protein
LVSDIVSQSAKNLFRNGHAHECDETYDETHNNPVNYFLFHVRISTFAFWI